ncbi:MAG TPA: sigma-54 dependent transcriptional regulator [Pseudobdellovibrionaceae bacterium]|nr:sigma-54 dependent transcriptional regulator [Pseudobdellovibrionaceae bacterium]
METLKAEDLIIGNEQQSNIFTSRNPFWQARLKEVSTMSKTNLPILLLGPTGTGKDRIAQEIHRASPRRQHPFMAVNCSALTETLLESELFGHVRGSFTGAVSDRRGAFEQARGGTLFLDEIGDLSLGAQSKLLRAIENHEIRPVGSDRIIHTNVRIVAATHKDLLKMVANGAFRLDLYYRLAVLVVNIPSLEERLEDFEDYVKVFSIEHSVHYLPEAIHLMRLAEWPGNIRQLKNFVSKTAAMYPGRTVGLKEVKYLLDGSGNGGPFGMTKDQSTTGSVLRDIERDLILKRLKENRGNQRLTALELGMPKSTLHDRLKSYGICAKDFKKPKISDVSKVLNGSAEEDGSANQATKKNENQANNVVSLLHPASEATTQTIQNETDKN